MQPDLEGKALALVEKAQAYTITDHARFEAVAHELRAVKSLAAIIKDSFKDSKERTHAAHKAVVEMEKKHLAPLQQAEVILKGKCLAWQQQERARIEAETKKALKAAAKTGDLTRLEAVQTQPAPEAAGLSTRTVYDFEVTDPDKLPRKYLVPNESLIRAEVSRLGLDAKIPGVRVSAREVLAARGL